MKAKNIKVGRRVQFKGYPNGVSSHIAINSVGTIIGDSVVTGSPQVSWDGYTNLRTDVKGYEGSVWIIACKYLRKYKD